MRHQHAFPSVDVAIDWHQLYTQGCSHLQGMHLTSSQHIAYQYDSIEAKKKRRLHPFQIFTRRTSSLPEAYSRRRQRIRYP